MILKQVFSPELSQLTFKVLKICQFSQIEHYSVNCGENMPDIDTHDIRTYLKQYPKDSRQT